MLLGRRCEPQTRCQPHFPAPCRCQTSLRFESFPAGGPVPFAFWERDPRSTLGSGDSPGTGEIVTAREAPAATRRGRARDRQRAAGNGQERRGLRAVPGPGQGRERSRSWPGVGGGHQSSEAITRAALLPSRVGPAASHRQRVPGTAPPRGRRLFLPPCLGPAPSRPQPPPGLGTARPRAALSHPRGSAQHGPEPPSATPGLGTAPSRPQPPPGLGTTRPRAALSHPAGLGTTRPRAALSHPAGLGVPGPGQGGSHGPLLCRCPPHSSSSPRARAFPRAPLSTGHCHHHCHLLLPPATATVTTGTHSLAVPRSHAVPLGRGAASPLSLQA
ncbi:uncharacterized protein GJ701_009081 [Geothlypis trichas]